VRGDRCSDWESPGIDLGRKTPRYQVKDVLAWLETRRRDGGRRRVAARWATCALCVVLPRLPILL